MNLIKFLESRAKDFLDRPAIWEDGEEITHRGLWQNVDKLAKAFLDIGIKEGDRIAICLPNCKEYIYTFLASLKINAIAVPLKQVTTSYEMKAILKDSHPSLLIADNIFINRMLPFNPAIGIGKLIICSKHIIKEGSAKRAISIDSLLKNTSELGTTFSADEGTVASINYTYRGYGYPLGAMLTHGNYLHGINAYRNRMEEISSHPRMLLLLPISHIFPLSISVILPLLIGGSVLIFKGGSPGSILEHIEKYKINMSAVTPTLVHMLLKNFTKHGTQINPLYAFCGGSPMLFNLYEEALKKIGLDLIQGYGLTECLVASTNSKLSNKPLTVGNVLHPIRLGIMSNCGERIRDDESGEIVIAGPTVMKGYYNKPKETRDVLKDGWCYSGDYGYFDEKGYLHFVGLKKQIIKVGGNIVDLVETKNTINSFHGVIDTKIDVIADKIWGQILSAEVFVKNPKEFDVKRLRYFLRDRLSSYKIPRLKIAG